MIGDDTEIRRERSSAPNFLRACQKRLSGPNLIQFEADACRSHRGRGGERHRRVSQDFFVDTRALCINLRSVIVARDVGGCFLFLETVSFKDCCCWENDDVSVRLSNRAKSGDAKSAQADNEGRKQRHFPLPSRKTRRRTVFSLKCALWVEIAFSFPGRSQALPVSLSKVASDRRKRQPKREIADV